MANLTFAVPRRRYPPISVNEVSSSQTFVLARKSNSTNWAWGRNQYGEIGNNTLNSYCSPVAICKNLTFCSISAGDNHGLGLDKNGKGWGWGYGTFGQLGDNSTSSRLTPVSVGGSNKTFCKISAGVTHSAAIDRRGQAWTWGRNLWGELGDKTVVQKNTPVSVSNAFTFCQITAGNSATAGIDKNGKVWGWGYIGNGQLGVGSLGGLCRCSPVSLGGAAKTFCQIKQGPNYGMAIDFRGRLWGWGTGDNGRIGDGTTIQRYTPVSVVGAVKTFCKISLAVNTTLAIDKNGKLWAWGSGFHGQTGRDTTGAVCTPVAVCGANKTFCEIGNGSTVSFAVDKNGKLWAWGYQFYGELGLDFTLTWTPISVTTNKTFCKIAVGFYNASAVDKNGLVFGWGQNPSGDIGNNTTTSRRSPVSIVGATKTFCSISSGQNYTIGLDKNGRAWGWGSNLYGNLGDFTAVSKLTPVSVVGAVKTFCQISTGEGHTVALTNAGRAWAWGYNVFGCLGDNTTASKRSPILVLGSTKTFCKIDAGTYYTLAITNTGRVWGWGYNNFGMLGDTTVTRRDTPVALSGTVKTFCQISAGDSHSLAIDKNGRAWAWGLGANGRLGDNTTVSKRTPVSVAGAVKTFCKITAGASHSLAIDKNGKLWVWGVNSSGQLGQGSYSQFLTPISLYGNKTFCEIYAGAGKETFSTAIDKNGKIWSWGNDFFGALGINSVNTFTPVSISYL